VIGGGISGLTAAYRLRQLVPSARVKVFEASDRLGGVLSTERHGDFLIERGADSFITKQPCALDLCHELGLVEQIIPTNSANRRALVLKGNELHPVPEGFVLIRPQRIGPILKTPLLSWPAKLRLLAERWQRRPLGIDDAAFDDNLAHFATERLGREAFERIVEPLVAGIYTADATKLSISATMPEAVQTVRQHGTLWHRTKSADEASSGARYGSFVTFRDGMNVLTDKLATHIAPDDLHLNQSVSQISRAGAAWTIKTFLGEVHGPFDGIVVALPTPQAANLLGEIDSQLAELLSQIVYASSAIVTLAVPEKQVGRPLDGFGFVVPRLENRAIIAASFSHVKFPSRAPKGTALIRVFMGGALGLDVAQLSDAELTQIALSELTRVLRITGSPLATHVTRWQQKMPQYHVGHRQLVDAIEERVQNLPAIALAGNGYRGVGIPHCVRSGDAAARKVTADLQLT
jgi:oxygen-dependent protoporphyrinogen oxidase